MRTARFGRVDVALPDPGDDLDPIDVLAGEEITEFAYENQTVRAIDLAGQRLARGRLRQVEADEVTLTKVTLDSVSLERCALLSGRWHSCTLTRVMLRDCRIVATTIDGQKWANLVFEGCAFDLVTFDTVRASGPVVFIDCRLREVTFEDCRLGRAIVRGCELRDVTIHGGDYTNADLRGNDLSTLRGAAWLAGAMVSRGQRAELAEALVAEVDLNYTEDDDDHPHQR